MKLCDTCIYRNNTEYEKPCIVYRDNCEYYEKERDDMTREEAIKELQESHDIMRSYDIDESESRLMTALDMAIKALEQEPKTGHCKECKYFEYDSVAKVDGVPLIVAHEICSRWGDGCKTREDGYCFLFEPQKSEDKE